MSKPQRSKRALAKRADETDAQAIIAEALLPSARGTKRTRSLGLIDLRERKTTDETENWLEAAHSEHSMAAVVHERCLQVQTQENPS